MKLLPVVFCAVVLGNNLFAQTSYYVAPTGSDLNDGSFATPFKTIARAKTAAADALHAGSTAANIYLRGGKHALIAPASDPLAPGVSITDADIPAGTAMTFRNQPGETAYVHGAIEFSGAAGGGSWSDTTLTDVYNGNISPTALKNVAVKKFTFTGALRDELQTRIQNLKAAGVNGGHFVFTQLYREESAGPVKKIRARQPNDDMTVDTSHFTWPGDDPLDHQVARCRFNSGKVVRTSGIPRFIDDGHTEIYFTRMWHTVRAIIHSPATTDSGDIRANLTDMENPKIGSDYTFPFERCVAEVNPTTSYGTNQHAVWETWNRGWMENNIHFLDAESEWFFDETNIVLYYRPPAGELVDSSVYSLPVTYTLFQLRGTNDASPVRGLRFTGEIVETKRLQFGKTAWKYENGRGNNKYYGFQFWGYGLSGLIDGIYVNDLRITDCAFNDTGATAIALGGNRRNLIGKMDSRDYFNQPRGIAANLWIVQNTFSRTGGAAIRVDHYPALNRHVPYPPNASDPPVYRIAGPEDLDNNTISYNDIFAAGTNFTETPAINVIHSINTDIENNKIMNTGYSGIAIGGSHKRTHAEINRVRFNRIDHAMTTLGDGAGIYTRSGRDTKVKDNFFERIGAPRAADAIAVTPFLCEIYFDRNSQLFEASGNVRLATEGFIRMMYRNSGNHTISQPNHIRPAAPTDPMDYGFDDAEALASSGGDIVPIAIPNLAVSSTFGGGIYILSRVETPANGDVIFHYIGGSSPLALVYIFATNSWECRLSTGGGVTIVPPTDYQGVLETIAEWIDLHPWYYSLAWPTNNLSLQ